MQELILVKRAAYLRRSELGREQLLNRETDTRAKREAMLIGVAPPQWIGQQIPFAETRRRLATFFKNVLPGLRSAAGMWLCTLGTTFYTGSRVWSFKGMAVERRDLNTRKVDTKRICC